MAKRKTLRVAKADRKLAREKEMQQFLKRMGYSGSGPEHSVHDIPDYRTNGTYATSNQIPSNGPKVRQNMYSGDQLLGIATMHKSNAVPIRKDNKQAAADTANMRRN